MSTAIPTSESRLRQIAILVASVDAVAARQLLLNLPTEIAKRVRILANQLGNIAPEERQAVLAEFQKSRSRPSNSTPPPSPTPASSHVVHEGFGSNSQSLAQLATHSTSGATEFSDSNPNAPAWTRLSVEALARFVRQERSTVIAVVLNQLPPQQAAAVLQRLPSSTSREVLHRLATLQEIDPEAMDAIDEHLSERLSEYHHKIQNELESANRINALLAAAPAELKQQWASWMRTDTEVANNGENRLASTMQALDQTAQLSEVNDNTSELADLFEDAIVSTLDPRVDPVAPSGLAPHASAVTVTVERVQPTNSSYQASQPPATDVGDRELDESEVLSFERAQNARQAAQEKLDRSQLQANFDRVLTLPATQLAVLLSSLSSETVLLALAGASPQFMKRFTDMLEPEDAEVLVERLQDIGPLNLRDIDEAQQRVVNAHSLLSKPLRKQAA